MKRMTIILMLTLGCVVFAQDKNPPTTLKGVLLEQLRTTHNDKDWFVPANIAVQGLTAEQANWSPGKGNHSIAQEVNHLIFWDAWSLMKFKGEKTPKFSGNNDETFNGADAKQWNAMVKQLDEVLTEWEKVLTEWEKAVEAADDAKIAASASMIAHVGAHNAYHIGQIIYIRKLQGSWDPKQGVK